MSKYGKVWGETEPLLQTESIEIHRIKARANTWCSEHYHKHKWNFFYCLGGTINVTCINSQGKQDTVSLSTGEHTTVPPGVKHWFSTTWGGEALEIYYLSGIDPLDIVRIGYGGSEDENDESSEKTLLTEGITLGPGPFAENDHVAVENSKGPW